MDDFFVRNRLSAYLDGELPLAEAREVEAALARSPALREEYEALKAAVDLLHRHGPVKAPADFAARLDERLAREPLPGSAWGRLRRVRVEVVAVVAMAALALVVVGKSVVGEDEAPETVAALPPAPTLPEPVEPSVANAPDAAGDAVGDAALAPPAPVAAGKGAPSKKLSTASGLGAVEKEAWQADWEQAPQAGAGEPAAEDAPPPASKVAFAPPPFRYRLDASRDDVLKQLIAVAGELGGQVTDGRGRPIADYPMDAGDARSVRITVPTYNVEALVARLRQLGEVDALSAQKDLLYAPGAQVPVEVDVRRE